MKKIYLVDDDVDLVESMTMILENAGYEVKSQNDENNLAENIIAAGPDLIILDMMLPGDFSAGLKMARSIADNDELKDTPVLMLSGVNKEGVFAGKISEKDIDAGFLKVNEFLEKPIDPQALLDKVESITS